MARSLKTDAVAKTHEERIEEINMSSQRRTAIVTGASQGIGAGIVKAFAERGFSVVANSRKVTQSTEVARFPSSYLVSRSFWPSSLPSFANS